MSKKLDSYMEKLKEVTIYVAASHFICLHNIEIVGVKVCQFVKFVQEQ